MEDIPQLYKESLQEVERLLSTKSVVGEPIRLEGAILVPLVSAGFGFGVGTGAGTDAKTNASGTGGGTGAGGGVKPVAVVVIDKTGVHVERVGASGMEALGTALAKALDDRGKKD